MSDPFEKLRSKYRKYDDWKGDALREEIRERWIEEDGPLKGSDFSLLEDAVQDELYDEFAKDMQDELNNLSPEERVFIFESIVEDVNHELEDCYTQRYADGAIKNLLLVQLVSQVVRTIKD